MSVSQATLWKLAPVGLLAVMVTGLGAMAAIATSDPSFALESDYYQKAVAYDQEIAQRSRNHELGWSLHAALGAATASGSSPLDVTLRDTAGPLVGAHLQVTALHNANAAARLETRLDETTPGHYRGALPLRRGGIWELRFSVVRGGDRFTQVIRREIGGLRP